MMILGLGWQAWLTVLVVVLLLVFLIREIARPDLSLLGAVGILLAFGVLTPEQAFAGFSNSALLAVGALFVVAAGVQRTGALSFMDRFLFSKSKNVRATLLRLMLPTAAMSAFLNNTPIVAMLMPRVQDWARKTGIPASKMLIPLSYAAIIGGMITLIGTSTNLLVSGFLQSAGYPPLGFFDLTWVGLPTALAVTVYFVLVGHRFLPERKSASDSQDVHLGQCFFEVRVSDRSPVVGLTVEEVGLRSLRDAYLVHVRRGDHIITSSPELVLQSGDTLTFLGNLLVLDQLLERPGFDRVVESLDGGTSQTLPLFEAVVSSESQLVGRTLRDVDFRKNYNGVVLGIRRKDEMIEGPLGRIPLRAGDLLLIEAHNGFDRKWNARRDEFYLVVSRRDKRPKKKSGKAPLALIILILVVLLAALDVMPIATSAFLGALAMIGTRCLTGREARQSVDVSLLVVIGAAIGLGSAMEVSGLAAALGGSIVRISSGLGPVFVVAAVYVSTSILTELITNNAAAVLMLPIGLAAAADVGISPIPMAVAVAVAASASFMTPIGYQTNLMVMSAGGYRFSDYLRTGTFVNLTVAVTAITVITLKWL